MALYVGLDVSLRTISICIVEAKGKVVWEGKVLCEGPALIAALAPYRKKIKRIGIEAGPLSEWLHGILTECHFNAVCIEARHAHRFLSSRPNKTDRNDARGIAEMMRLGPSVTIPHAEQAARAAAHVRPWSALRAPRWSPVRASWPQSAGWSDGGNRHVLTPSHAEAHPRLLMRQGAAAAHPRQPACGGSSTAFRPKRASSLGCHGRTAAARGRMTAGKWVSAG